MKGFSERAPGAARVVLIVDDDERSREELARDFRRRGHSARTAASRAQAMATLREIRPGLAVIGLPLADYSAFDVLCDVKERSPRTSVVMLGHLSVEDAVEAGRLGARKYLCRPIDADGILAAVEGPPEGSPRTSWRRVERSLACVESEHINSILGDCRGNISEAARALGIDRRTLQRKLQKLPDVG